MKSEQKQTHKSKFFSIGQKHCLHVQLCHYPGSCPEDGMFIFLQKEVGPQGWKRMEDVNHLLHPIRDKVHIAQIFESFGEEEAEKYARKLSPRLKF